MQQHLMDDDDDDSIVLSQWPKSPLRSSSPLPFPQLWKPPPPLSSKHTSFCTPTTPLMTVMMGDEDTTDTTVSTSTSGMDASYQGGGGSAIGEWESPFIIRRITSSSSSSRFLLNTSSSSPLSLVAAPTSNINNNNINNKMEDDNEQPQLKLQESATSSYFYEDQDENRRISACSCRHPAARNSQQSQQNLDDVNDDPRKQAVFSLSQQERDDGHYQQQERDDGHYHYHYQKRLQQLEEDSSKTVGDLRRELNEAKRQIEVFQFAWNEERSTPHLDIDILGDQFLQIQAQLESYKLENAQLRQKVQAQELQAVTTTMSPPRISTTTTAAPQLWASKEQPSPRLLTSINLPVVAAAPTFSLQSNDPSSRQEPLPIVVEESSSSKEKESTISKLRSKNASLRSRLEDEFSKVGGSTANHQERTTTRTLQEQFHAQNVDRLSSSNEHLRQQVESLLVAQETGQHETERRLQDYESRLAFQRLQYRSLETKHASALIQIEQLMTEKQQLVEQEKQMKESMMQKYDAKITTLALEKSNLLEKLEEETVNARVAKQGTLEAESTCELLEEETTRLRDQLEEHRAEGILVAAQHVASQSQLLSELEQRSISNVQLEAQLEELQHLKHVQSEAAEKRYIALECRLKITKAAMDCLERSNDQLMIDRQNLQTSAEESQRRIAELESAQLQMHEQLSSALLSKTKTELEKDQMEAELMQFRISHSEMKNRLREIGKQHEDCVHEIHSTLFGLW